MSGLSTKAQIQHENTQRIRRMVPLGRRSEAFITKPSNSAAEHNWRDPGPFQRDLQYKDILLADVQGWKMASNGFICYMWLQARGIRAAHTNVGIKIPLNILLLPLTVHIYSGPTRI